MIYTINLSLPRKKVLRSYDNIMFEIKYKNINISKLFKVSAGISILALLSSSDTFAKDIVIKEFNGKIEEVFKTLGYPTFDAIYQMIKMGDLAYGHVD